MAIKTFLFLYIKMLFIHVMAKLKFQHHYFSLQCHVFLQKYPDLMLKSISYQC